MPRPRSLTNTAIAQAALAVLEREGIDALSMRAIGAKLGVAPMSLYRYVAGRDEVEDLVVDFVLSKVDLEPPPRGRWTTKAAVLLERFRDAVASQPAVVPLLLTRRHRSESVFGLAEVLLRLLSEAGFSGRQRAVALRALLGYVIGAIQVEHLGPLAGPGTDALAALPVETYPLLSETARHARRITAADEFHQGLIMLLSGLDRTASGSHARS